MNSFNALIEYELTNSSSGPSRVKKQIADISVDGLAFEPEGPVRVGSRICVRFELPNTERIIAVAQCVTKTRRTARFNFVSLDNEDRDAIEAHIAGSVEQSAA